MQKKTSKTQGTCPICQKSIVPPNEWVKYHIRYSPPLVIMGCKYCNFIEYQLRNNLPFKRGYADMHRIKKVIGLHSSFGIKL